VRALPTLFNNVLFRVLARNEQGELRIGHVSAVATEPVDFLRLAPERVDLVEQALHSDRGRLFRWFSDGWLHIDSYQAQGRSKEVILSDQRFGLLTEPTSSFFRARFRFDGAGRLLGAERIDRGSEPEVGRELSAMWTAMWGGEPGQSGS
jgi:hypothetical protein